MASATYCGWQCPSMDTVHNLLWWSMYIDRQLSQPIAADNGHRCTRFPIYCGHCLSIDSIPSPLLPIQTIAAKFPILWSLTIFIHRHAPQSIVAGNGHRYIFPLVHFRSNRLLLSLLFRVYKDQHVGSCFDAFSSGVAVFSGRYGKIITSLHGSPRIFTDVCRF